MIDLKKPRYQNFRHLRFENLLHIKFEKSYRYIHFFILVKAYKVIDLENDH